MNGTTGIRTLIVALVLAVAPAATAQGSIALGGAKAEPIDSTAANANSRFHIHLDLGGTEHIRDLTQSLPFGIGPDLLQLTCPPASFDPADACPANTRIGTTTVLATVGPVVPNPLTQQTITGRIYYLAPDGGNPFPSLGIVLDAPTGKVFQRGEATISASGLSTTIRNFPQTTDVMGVPVPTRIDSLDIVLVSSFLRNPPTCDPAKTRFSVISYEDPGTTSKTEAGFTPTGCPPEPSPAARRCAGKRATRVGTRGADAIRGTKRRDVIVALAGADRIRGLGGNDLICAGAGRDRLHGGPGRDLLLGGPGPDQLRGGRGRDVLRGGPGADSARQ